MVVDSSSAPIPTGADSAQLPGMASAGTDLRVQEAMILPLALRQPCPPNDFGWTASAGLLGEMSQAPRVISRASVELGDRPYTREENSTLQV